MLLLTSLLVAAATAYKPVIMMHGVGSDAGEMATIERLLNTSHPGTIVTSLPLFEGQPASWDHNLEKQVAGVIAAIRTLIAANPAAYKDGYHMVCKSQGALTCRCVIEAMDDHNVSTFVSLAGPQVGVYGDAYFAALKIPFLEKTTAEAAWLVAYNTLGQEISVGNMWRDPKHLTEYGKSDIFLPKYTEHATPVMKANFLRLERAVFCVGSGRAYDGGIEPWQTGSWGAYDANLHMLNMTEQPFYTKDSFGLKTLHTTGRLNLTIVPGVSHSDWTANEAIIKEHVLPHCT